MLTGARTKQDPPPYPAPHRVENPDAEVAAVARSETVVRARSLGLVERVSNQLDGTVLVLAEGSRCRGEDLAAWLSRGPRHAIVTAVGLEWSPPRHRWKRFAIDHT